MNRVGRGLRAIFEPEGVAVVGASRRMSKRGHQVFAALCESDFAGDAYAVNPRGGRILGRMVFASLKDLPDRCDLAVLCTPARLAPALVRECAECEIPAALVLASGFGESGEEGRRLERDLRRSALEGDVRVVGPNTSGILNLHSKLNLVGARGVRKGSVSILAQSGNIALALMNEATERSWDGIAVYAGLGNSVDVGFPEVLDYLRDHAPTKAACAYVEGGERAREFLEAARSFTQTKPLVVIKSGRTRKGAQAALSHTGRVTGSYASFSAGLAQAGATEVARTDELLSTALALGNQPAPKSGAGIAILSDGGGQGALAADALTEAGATLARLSSKARDALIEALGPSSAARNPVDVAGAADRSPWAFAEAADAILRDPGVGSLLIAGLFGGYAVRFSKSLKDEEIKAARRIRDLAALRGKPLVVYSMYARERTRPLALLGRAGIPVIGSLEAACAAAARLHERSERLAAQRKDDWPPEQKDSIAAIQARARPPRIRFEGGRLRESDARRLLESQGVDFGPWRIAKSPKEAASCFRSLGGDAVVLKLDSARIAHRSDIGGVALGLKSEEEAIKAAERLAKARSSLLSEGKTSFAAPCSLLVAPMAPPPRAELLVGVYREPGLGPVLVISSGGVLAEALGDVARRVLPISRRSVRAMVRELRIHAALDAKRGRRRASLRGIEDCAAALASLVEIHPEIVEIEINPLLVYDDRALAVDALLVGAPAA